MPGAIQRQQNAWDQLNQVQYGGRAPWNNPALGMASFKQQHPGVMNLVNRGEPLYLDPRVQQTITEEYGRGLGFEDMPFLERLLSIFAENDEKKKKKKKRTR